MRKTSQGFSLSRVSTGFLLLVATLLLLGPAPSRIADAATPGAQGLSGATLIKQVPYVPTPQDIVDKMLELAKVTSDDVVYDLGSGDGRIVITAAQKLGAHAVGVEINPDLYRQSSNRIKELGLDDRAHIVCEDMFDVSLSRATVVTLYLLTSFNEKLRPKLERQLHSGARIVCHDFHIPGWDPEKVVDVTSKNGIPHKLYLYIRP
ncbi:MAG: methyltransferase domain-containing protein [Terriglobia bacterium]|jgi:SAM-dependent methyltransferase